ncbi:MAG: hypothetical protein ACK4N5_19350, partial [Myxococcales bacterium]
MSNSHTSPSPQQPLPQGEAGTQARGQAIDDLAHIGQIALVEALEGAVEQFGLGALPGAGAPLAAG